MPSARATTTLHVHHARGLHPGCAATTRHRAAARYTTFARLAGVNETDGAAAAAGLPPVDGVDQWPTLTGGVRRGAAPVRGEVWLSTEALIVGHTKLVRGVQEMSGWTGPTYPNGTGPQPLFPHSPIGTWKHDCRAGCLYDIWEDPNEHSDLAEARPRLVASLGARLDELNRGHYEPDRGKGDKAACAAAIKYGGFYGPFLD